VPGLTLELASASAEPRSRSGAIVAPLILLPRIWFPVSLADASATPYPWEPRTLLIAIWLFVE
jgi:hypothetical protein